MSSSVLPWQWVIEHLAGVPDAGTSILSALVDRFPDVLADSSGAVRERLALRYLEECSGMSCGETPPAVATIAPSKSASAAKIDAGQTCEEVLRSKVVASNNNCKGKACLDGGDLHQFILLKRSTLPKSSIELLKEKILTSYQYDFSYLEEGKGLPKVSRSCINLPTSSSHRDHGHGVKKIIKTMKCASPWMKKLSIIRKYRKLKNLTNTPSSVDEGLQKENTSQHPLAEQNALDDEKRNKQTEKTKAIPGEWSAEFHDVEVQSLKDSISDCAPALNGDPDNSKVSTGSGSDCGEVQLLEQRSMLQPSSAQSFCIKCGTSGQVLSCRGDGCSRVIHESCLGPLMASVEKTEIFYCPICAYRNARMMYEKSKRKAKEARRNLFSFYDVCPAVHAMTKKNSSAKRSGGQKHDATQNAETSKSAFARQDKQKFTQNQLDGEDDIVFNNILPCIKIMECHLRQVVQDTLIKLKNDTGRGHESDRVTEDQQPVNGHVSGKVTSHEARENVHTGDEDQERLSFNANKSSPLKVGRECDHNAKRKALSSQISDRFAKRDRRDKAASTDDYQGVEENQQTYNSPSRKLRKSKYLPNRCSTMKRPPIRRKMLIWKPEEEEVLEEAMQKVAKNDDGSIAWIKILEYGRRVLHQSRTPIDLKDKWRNMQKKEAKTCV